MNRKTLYFTAPQQVELREEPLPAPGAEQVLVETVCSAVSAGTEMLVYSGQFPDPADTLDPVSSDLHYPTSYGYASVGRVVETGKDVGREWHGRLVFAFQPHTTHFVAGLDAIHPLPEGVSSETACFLPNMETAVNLAQDAAPILGERGLVLGQGIVGLLTAALLAQFPLEILVTADRYDLRRRASMNAGASESLDPAGPDFRQRASALLKSGADLTLELSGSPSTLNEAIALTGFNGRVVIGSWYGRKQAPLDLGGAFHRSRIKLISSQVSTISPGLSGRWDKGRRFEAAWGALKHVRPEKWITHRLPFHEAERAYRLLEERPQETIQVLFTY